MAEKAGDPRVQNVIKAGMPKAEMIWWGLFGLTVFAGIALMVIAVTVGRV